MFTYYVHIWINNFSDTSLVGKDTLTCGECKQDFKLQELTLFIQHKALNSCKKNKSAKNLGKDCDFDEVNKIFLKKICQSSNHILHFVCRLNQVLLRTEIMFLWVPPVYLDQVRIFEYLNEKFFFYHPYYFQDKPNVIQTQVIKQQFP